MERQLRGRRAEADTGSCGAKLDHPNVIRVFDSVDGRPPLLVLELLKGQTLADRLCRDGALPR
jgi:hypothetical protein